jgi:hypothetical protein
MADDLTDLDLPAADAIGVWYDLERALAGRNGYGGDVAEIYAYRLTRMLLHDPHNEEQAGIAGKNMTRLLHYFLELHEGAIVSIEDRDGFRPLDLATEEFPPFGWRVHLRVTQAGKPKPAFSIHDLRKTLAETVERAEVLTAMLDELAQLRAKDRLRAEPREPAAMDDLPPDSATGLYLDVPFTAEDLEWIKMAWDAYLSRGDGGGPKRAGQLMLVFQAIRRDERSTTEFLRVMNTVVLPLCRRLRLKIQPQLSQLGAASE